MKKYKVSLANGHELVIEAQNMVVKDGAVLFGNALGSSGPDVVAVIPLDKVFWICEAKSLKEEPE